MKKTRILYENNFCIYWKNDSCILEEIELESGRTSRSQTVIMLDAETLDKLRNKALEAEKSG